MDSILPGSSVHVISQARILAQVVISSSRGSSDPGIEPASPIWMQKRLVLKVDWNLASYFLLKFFSDSASQSLRCSACALSHFSCVWLFVILWTVTHQAPLSIGFSRQEYWSGLPFPSSMRESEKWKSSRSVASDFVATPWTAAYQAPPMEIHGIF